MIYTLTLTNYAKNYKKKILTVHKTLEKWKVPQNFSDNNSDRVLLP